MAWLVGIRIVHLLAIILEFREQSGHEVVVIGASG
jgi:hypothetical protein